MSAILETLNTLMLSREQEIAEWFESMFRRSPPFFYNSVDIRHSGFKIAPVDTNLFPGGFNNLTEKERENAAQKATAYFKRHYPGVKCVLVMAEDHTRNLYYLENVAVLRDILKAAGVEAILSSLAVSQSGKAEELVSQSGKPLTYEPCEKVNGAIQTLDGKRPDLVLVNNDMTTGAPELITDIAQIVTPPLGFGWYKRRKTSHFDTYNDLLRNFCRQFEVDPWLMSTLFHKCGAVNFKERNGLECVAVGVDKTLHRIRQKYDEYGIKDEPYVFIKSDKGTYGMGIMTARSGQDVMEMGKKIRNKMTSIKGGEANTSVIIQEGVPTVDVVDGNPAEPMIYLVGGETVGWIYRLNTRKDNMGNLNASGMQFASMAEHHKGPCKALCFIAKLASYASSWECYTESYSI